MLEKSKIPSLSVVIPVFNEEDTINSLLYYVSNSNIVSELTKLKELLDSGAITKEEFQKAKEKILNK